VEVNQSRQRPAGDSEEDKMDLGRVGIWHVFDGVPPKETRSAVAEIERFGFKTVWIPEAGGREAFVSSSVILDATDSLIAATGIANLHMREPMSMNAGWQTLSDAFPGRFLLGIGVSHQPLVEGVIGTTYSKPYSTMVKYLDGMDAGLYFGTKPEVAPVRVLAALGPKMLKLAAERTSGAHPYFVPVEHTKFAREILGPSPMLNTELAVVITKDLDEGRRIAREYMATYLRLPNYTNNLKRFGWTDQDIEENNDRLLDAIVPVGDIDYVTTRIKAHLDAGASHVCVQVLSGKFNKLPYEVWKVLADAVRGL